MKVSIITVCLNSQSTIRETIESVINQSYNNIEYIIVDGCSTDRTLSIIEEYSTSIDYIITGNDNGIYDAMNKGINSASGDLIGILNSDDIYYDKFVISEVVNNYNKFQCNIIFGDLVFFSDLSPNKIVRKYASKSFRTWKLRFGWMPPHPATFFHKTIYINHGLYSNHFSTGSDYELFVRLLMRKKLPFKHINKILVKMRMGGATTSGIKSLVRTSHEIVSAVKLNGFYTNYFLIYMRIPIKFLENIKLL